MIKVIASDLDGTLLNDRQIISERSVDAIRKAQEAGIRFIVVTGRHMSGTQDAIRGRFENVDLITSSGAEVWDSDGNLVSKTPLEWKQCEEIEKVLRSFDLVTKYNGFEQNGFIGSMDDYENLLLQDLQVFNRSLTPEQIREMPAYQMRIRNSKAYKNLEDLKKKIPEVAKVFSFSQDLDMVNRARKALSSISNTAVASSFPDNIEVTNSAAQKGPVLKNYIESLGFSMDEVLVFGDSLNDESMMGMDFVTVAVDNADDRIKEISRYITKSNAEDGVAYVIEEMLKKQNGKTE